MSIPLNISRRLTATALLLVVGLLAGGCSLVGSEKPTYSMTVFFDRAVSLYPESSVQVMGINSGEILEVEPMGDTVRVELEINADVPVPADVKAAVVPLSLIGERNVVLFPSWTEGMDRAQDGDTIPVERTEIPVEPDEALQAFTDLARGLDPDEVARLVSEGAEALDGKGDLINGALAELGDLSQLIAREDDSLVAVAENLDQLAATLNTREDQLGRVLDDFSSATGVLAAERGEIEALLSGLGDLAEVGNDFVAAHESDLPEDLAQLSRLVRAGEANLEAVAQLVRALAANNEGLIAAHNDELDVLAQRINLTPITREVLRPLFQSLGVDDLTGIPCVPQPGVSC